MDLIVPSQEPFFGLSSGTCSLVFYSFLKTDFEQNAFRSRETCFHHELITLESQEDRKISVFRHSAFHLCTSSFILYYL